MDLRKSIAYCFQSPYLFGSSVLDNVKFPYIIRNMKPDIEKIETWFAMFNMIGDYLQKDVKNLSGGEKQRIALIRSILFMSEILLLDGITSALDSYNTSVVEDVVIGVMRAAVQLVIVGYILEFVFGYNNHIFTTTLLAFMIFNAAYNAAKRGKSIKSGMLVGNSMVALGFCYEQIDAIKYQIMVTFMLLSTTAISSLVACYLSYRSFFNKRKQLTI